jgi:hypothetical protein
MPPGNGLFRERIERTGDWIASHQRPDGGIPWFVDDRLDAWNHVQCAMALTAVERYPEARAAFRYLQGSQLPEGAWPSLATPEEVLDPARDSNHAAYLASGLWFYHLATSDTDLLAELWPTLERAIDFVVGLQEPDGVLRWAADPEGNTWPAPLLAGSSSAYGSLQCAARIAQRLGHERPHWETARSRLGEVLRGDLSEFLEADVPQPPGHFGMDWYYPVLGGALRNGAGLARLAEDFDFWVRDLYGCRCVAPRPWYTVAESCELAIALDACGLSDDARELAAWVDRRREDDGGYWTGTVLVDGEGVIWPEERPTWTAATVILAADALAGDSPTSGFFRSLGETNGHGV